MGRWGLSSLETSHAPITDFLVALLNSTQPFHEVPGKYWDLSPANSEPLKNFSPIHLHIEVKEFRSGTLCLLQNPDSLPLTDWCIAVDLMTSLECIHETLGPSLIDVTEFLIKHGISFCTLVPLSNLISPTENAPATSFHQFLGYRPHQYQFDLADFAAYETFWESFLLAQPQGHHALCYGGIVGHLAWETLPDSVALAGPSYSALQGQQETFHDWGDLFVDNRLSDRDLDLICGTYDVGTEQHGMYDFFCCWSVLTILSSRANCNTILVPKGEYLGKFWLQCRLLEQGVWKLLSQPPYWNSVGERFSSYFEGMAPKNKDESESSQAHLSDEQGCSFVPPILAGRFSYTFSFSSPYITFCSLITVLYCYTVIFSSSCYKHNMQITCCLYQKCSMDRSWQSQTLLWTQRIQRRIT